MGLGIFDGNSFGEMLIKQEAPCMKCGKPIQFEKGCNLARKKGITANVVVCSKCNSVFEVMLVPGKMTLTSDVTEKYR